MFKADKNQKNSKGFAPAIMALIVVAVLGIAGFGAYVVLNKDETPTELTSQSAEKIEQLSQTEEIQSVGAVVEQIDAEASLEDSLISEEEKELEYDDSVLNELGDLSNENNL